MNKFKILLILAASSFSAVANSQTWQTLGFTNRYGHSAVLDTSTGQMVTFGGTDGSRVFNDTWGEATTSSTNHNLTWNQISGDSIQKAGHAIRSAALTLPAANTMLAPPRTDAPAVMDLAHNNIHISGGQLTWGSNTFLDNHVFTLDANTLSYTHPAPESRQAHTAVLDGDTMWVFGGLHSTTFGALTQLVKTSVDSESWTNVTPKLGASNPPPMFGHSAAMNSSTGVMTVAFGATTAVTLAPCLNTVYQLQQMHSANPVWAQVNTGPGPQPRAFAASAYDSVTDTLIAFGGTDCAGHYDGDTWLLQNATSPNARWVELLSPGPCSAREGATLVYDPASNQALLYGGDTGSHSWLGDLWLLQNANGNGGASQWVPLTPTGPNPTARSGHWAVWDSANGTMYMGGGTGQSGMLADTWTLTGGTDGNPVWQQLVTTGSILNNSQASAVIADNMITVFGGARVFSGSKAQDFSPTGDEAWQLEVE